MKKRLLLFMSILSIFIFCGCVDTDITVDMDKKGNMVIYSDVLVKDSVFENLSKEDLDKLKAKYDHVEKITSKGKSGYKITERVGNIKSIKNNSLDKVEGAEEFKKLLDIKQNKNIFYNEYDINFKIKEYLLENKNTEKGINENKTLLAAIGSSSNANFHLKIPIKLLESNATSESQQNGQYVYNWEYEMNSMDNIHIKAKVYNTKNIALLSILIITIIAAVIVLIIRMKNKTRMD